MQREETFAFRDVFNNSVVLDMDETGSSILFKSGRQLNRRWGLTSVARSIITARPHTPTHETEILCGPPRSIYTKHRDGTGQCIRMCLCLSASMNTNTHTHIHIKKHSKPCCGETHPSPVPHLENPKTKLMPLFFNYLSSHHRHHTKSIQILPQSLFCNFSLVSNVSMCYHHKCTHTCTHTHTHTHHKSGNHNIIKSIKGILYD